MCSLYLKMHPLCKNAYYFLTLVELNSKLKCVCLRNTFCRRCPTCCQGRLPVGWSWRQKEMGTSRRVEVAVVQVAAVLAGCGDVSAAAASCGPRGGTEMCRRLATGGGLCTGRETSTALVNVGKCVLTEGPFFRCDVSDSEEKKRGKECLFVPQMF